MIIRLMLGIMIIGVCFSNAYGQDNKARIVANFVEKYGIPERDEEGGIILHNIDSFGYPKFRKLTFIVHPEGCLSILMDNAIGITDEDVDGTPDLIVGGSMGSFMRIRGFRKKVRKKYYKLYDEMLAWFIKEHVED